MQRRIPEEFNKGHESKQKWRGVSDIVIRKPGELWVVKWMDTRSVAMASTVRGIEPAINSWI